MPDPFDTLNLRPALLEALAQVGYATMTPIQAAALPLILAGRDVTGQAKTGSGKTAAFGLGLLNSIAADGGVQALVLCPTRELVEQVADELRRLAQRLDNVQVVAVTGGVPVRQQVLSLAAQSQVVVGTPGRVGDHLRRGSLTLTGLQTLVLDEADRMLQMGFIDQVTEIVKASPRGRQTLLFSATFPEEIERLAKRVQRSPTFVAVDAQVDGETLQQRIYTCEPSERQQMVANLLGAERATAALVFCETRADGIELATFLNGKGAVALALHGDLEQRDRTDVLLQFANGSASVLVATNVAARGLDIPAMPLVVIAELSRDPEDHVHRVGRTGRAGEPGLALSIVASGPERERRARIEALLGRALPDARLPGTVDRLDNLRPMNRTLILLSGRKEKLRKGDVLGALVKDAGLPAEAIGRIDLMESSCAVAVRRDVAQRALQFVQGSRIKKVRVRALLLG